jgi:hypothetical protein
VKTSDESPDDAAHPDADHESEASEWVPNLAERLRTIERANLALDRARLLLERANGFGPADANFPDPSNDEAA